MRLIYIFIILCLSVLVSCLSNCDEKLPKPLSFNIQWVDTKGNDLYSQKVFQKDSLRAYFKQRTKQIEVRLEVERMRTDTMVHFISLMPLIRTARTQLIDTVYIAPNSKDIDTIFVQIKEKRSECFSSLYEFEKIEYNNVSLSGIDSLYKIIK